MCVREGMCVGVCVWDSNGGTDSYPSVCLLTLKLDRQMWRACVCVLESVCLLRAHTRLLCLPEVSCGLCSLLKVCLLTWCLCVCVCFSSAGWLRSSSTHEGSGNAPQSDGDPRWQTVSVFALLRVFAG